MGMLFAVAGCGPGAKAPPPKAPPKPPPVLQQPLTVNTTGGDATIRSNGPARAILYHIRWKDAALQVSDNGPFAGTMNGVTGEFYERGAIACEFSADHASANKDEDLLVLTGHARAYSPTQKATLSCDKLEWHAKEKVVKAFGHIEIAGVYDLLGLDEVWAKSDLSYLATPAMFKKP